MKIITTVTNDNIVKDISRKAADNLALEFTLINDWDAAIPFLRESRTDILLLDLDPNQADADGIYTFIRQMEYQPLLFILSKYNEIITGLPPNPRLLYLDTPLKIEDLTESIKKALFREMPIRDRDMNELQNHLPFLNIQDSLDSFFEDLEQYHVFLQSFYHKYQDEGEKIQSLYIRGHFEALRPLVHNIKTNCGLLGYPELQDKARKLEEGLVKKDRSVVKTTYPVFKDELSSLMTRLAQLFIH